LIVPPVRVWRVLPTVTEALLFILRIPVPPFAEDVPPTYADPVLFQVEPLPVIVTVPDELGSAAILVVTLVNKPLD
jgi:hypothetical protein